MHRRSDIEKEVITPVLFLINVQDNIINRFKYLVDIISRTLLLVAEHHQEFQRCIARALSHTVERAVRQEAALRIEREKMLRIRITELEIVVRVVTDTNLRVEIRVQNAVYMAQMLLVEQSVGIDHRRRIGHDLVDKLRILGELLIRIRRDGNHLCKDLVAELLDLGAKLQGSLHLRFLEDHADAVEERLLARLQTLNTAGAVVDHAEDERVPLGNSFEHAADGSRVGQDRTPAVETALFIKEAHLNELHARTYEPLKDFYNPIVAKLPIVYIAAVTQRTIKQQPLSQSKSLPSSYRTRPHLTLFI